MRIEKKARKFIIDYYKKLKIFRAHTNKKNKEIKIDFFLFVPIFEK